ncbi:hypothetical protein MJH12_10885, partial [bacterium]|nr:hypothetical protein [bacterium]
MNYYKLQSIFVLVLCSLYLLVTQVSFQVKSKNEYQQELKKFQNILNEKNSLLTNIKTSKHDLFVNYNKKLKIIKITSNPFLEKLHGLLKHKNWKKDLKKTKIPFQSQSCLIIGKNGKKVFKTGHSMNDVFEKKWEKSVFLALKNKDTMFSRMQAIYRYNMTPKNFQNYFQKFQVLYLKNKQFVYRFYTKIDKYEVFYFIRLNLVQHSQLQEAIIKFFVSNDSKLKASHQDLIIWNDQKILINMSKMGLTYQAKYHSYYQYIYDLNFFNTFFIVMALLLYYFGGYKIIAFHFEFKLVMRYTSV